MDIFAHALWTHAVHRGVAKTKESKLTKKAIWTVIFFGVAPDLFSFGLFFVARVYQAIFLGQQFFNFGPPNPAFAQSIPAYVYNSYNYTHSLVLFLVTFGVVWAIRNKPYWLMFGWGFHILIDIFSHATSFFPTPFLFPISNFRVNGYSWGHPTFMVINYSLLALTYLGFYIYSKNKKPDRSQA